MCRVDRGKFISGTELAEPKIGPFEEGERVSESEQRVLWRLPRRGLGSCEKGAENSPPRPPFSATFSPPPSKIIVVP
jgi:hypothetical protein